MIVKYFNGAMQKEKLKHIFQEIKNDNDRLRRQPAYKIFRDIVNDGGKTIIALAGTIGFCGVAYFTLMTALILYDVSMKNESEDKYLMYQVEYHFFDPQQYYYTVTATFYLSSMMCIAVFASLDSMYMLFIQHACALFAVSGYDLKTAHILDRDILKNVEDVSKKGQEQIYKKLTSGIEAHKRALHFAKSIQDLYSKALLVQIVLNILCLSLTGVQALLIMGNITDLMRLGTWVFGQVLHLFFLCFPGQRLMDFSERLYYDGIECRWHLMNSKSQVLYQFFIMNNLTPYTMTTMKVTTLNFETFSSVIQTAVSYFTVLSSTI